MGADDMGGCDFIEENSLNVKAYGWCSDIAYNNEDACKANNGEWKEYGPLKDYYDFIDEPECLESAWSKENHLGHGLNGRMNSYNWTIPDNAGATCALRLRYNMSQGEIDWNLDYKSNGDASPVRERSNSGGANDVVFNYAGDKYPQVPLWIAANTDQFTRAFQDRTHLFEIRERPDGVDPRALIYNLGNKGTRGNLQNIYPMVENDFCPEFLSSELVTMSTSNSMVLTMVETLTETKPLVPVELVAIVLTVSTLFNSKILKITSLSVLKNKQCLKTRILQSLLPSLAKMLATVIPSKMKTIKVMLLKMKMQMITVVSSTLLTTVTLISALSV